MKYVLALMVVAALVIAAVIALAPRDGYAPSPDAPITGDYAAAKVLAGKLGARLLIAVDERPT